MRLSLKAMIGPRVRLLKRTKASNTSWSTATEPVCEPICLPRAVPLTDGCSSATFAELNALGAFA